MVDFPSAVNAPGGASYTTPLVNAVQTFQNAQQNQQKTQANQNALNLAQTFKNGLPMNPDGTPNYAAMAQMLARNGNPNAAVQLAPQIQAQQPVALSPYLGGSQPQGSGAKGGASNGVPPPPAGFQIVP